MNLPYGTSVGNNQGTKGPNQDPMDVVTNGDAVSSLPPRRPPTLTDHLNIYWMSISGLCIWFLFIHTPPFIVKRRLWATDAALSTHLAGAYTIYLTCMFNTFVTPSQLTTPTLHKWMGRVGMVAGYVSFALGFYCTWLRSSLPPMGFRVGITIGGLAQVAAQTIGYSSIKVYQKAAHPDVRRKALLTHISSMVSLFTAACSIPAALRIVDLIPSENGQVIGLIGSIVGLQMLVPPFTKTYYKQD